MKLDVLHVLRNPGTEYAFSAEQTMAPQDVSGSEVSFDPVQLTGVLMAADDGSVTMDGRLTTVAHAQCANCLAPASSVVEGEFRETFIFEGDPEDDEHFAYQGSALDLEKITLSYVLLNLPMRFKCPVECRADGELKAWNEAEKIWAEEETENEGTYRPFEQLKQMMEEREQ